MSTRPLVYFWVAHYNDGAMLYQYDPLDYTENSFSDIDQNKLVKFSLHPFDSEFADSINKDRGKTEVISLPLLPSYSLKLDHYRRLIYYRDVFISQEEYHLCRNCNKEFYFHSQSQTVDSKYSSPICPFCGAHDLFVCKSCGEVYDRFEDAPFHMCGKCKGHLERRRITSGQYIREKSWIEYYLGYQITVNGRNHKFLMKIKEDGSAEIV